jgi:hypothetical protein
MSAKNGIYFNDDHEPVLAVEMDFEAMDRRLAGETGDDEVLKDSTAVASSEVNLWLLEWLSADGASAPEIGQRVLILKHLVRPVETQRELAARMRIDEGQLSRKVKLLRGKFCNNHKGF